MRLFLLRVFVALNQALADTETGIAVGVPAHLALWAEAERRAGSVARFWLSLVIATDVRVAAVAFSARIPWVDPAGDDPHVPRLVLRVAENAPFHPVGPFRIATAAIRALFWLQVAQVLKDEDTGLVLPRELNNASAQQVRDMFIDVPDFGPEIGIVLFSFGDNARLASVACNAAKQFLPTARYLWSISDKGGSQDGAVNCLDATHG